MSVKHNLLSALERHRGEEISGQELADLLHVSRAAVWKAAKALEAEGYGIDALPGRGYRCVRIATSCRRRASASICPRNMRTAPWRPCRRSPPPIRRPNGRRWSQVRSAACWRPTPDGRTGTAAEALFFPGGHWAVSQPDVAAHPLLQRYGARDHGSGGGGGAGAGAADGPASRNQMGQRPAD